VSSAPEVDRDDFESRLRFERLLTDLLSGFLNVSSNDVDQEIEDAQRRVCETFGLNLSTVWQWPPHDPERWILTHHYRKLGGLPPPDPMDAREHFPWTLSQLRIGGAVSLPSTAAAPPEAARDLETWNHFGITSTFILPLSVGGSEPFGSLSFGSTEEGRVWPGELAQRLRLVAPVFASALARKRTDHALREGEQRLSLALASAGAGAWDLDVATGRIWATPEAKVLYGFSAGDDVDLAGFLARVYPEDRELVRLRLRDALSQQAAYSADYRLVLPDGSIRWINARGCPHAADATGRRERLLGVSADVTERVRTDLLLKEKGARLAAAIDAVALGFYETQEGGRIVFVDDRLRELLGVQPYDEERIREFWLEHIHPDDRARIHEVSLGVVEGRSDRGSVEYRYLHPRGSTLWLNHVSHALEHDATGRTTRIVGVIQDITQRKLAEAALIDRTERLSMALASGRMGAWDMKLPEQTITWAESSEDLFGLGPGRFPEHAAEFASFEHPGHREAIAAAFRKLHSEAGSATVEARVLWPDGSERWHQIFARSVAGPEGSPVHVTGLTLDITARRRNEESLRRALEEVQHLRDQLREENLYLRHEVKELQNPSHVAGQSVAIQRVFAQVRQVAPTGSTVLLLGETGTGKERFASAIHDLSPRRDRPMVRVNCAAIPTPLIESELFGREKGAYTGALSRQAGRFELAHGSTLFLDEVGDLPPEVQVKLLRVLQERQIERLGSPRPIPVDVRIIAATNQDLREAVRAGRFREDLYYRLNVFPILIPPLRERPEDIPLLVAALVDELGAAMNKRVDAIAKASMDTLTAYAWPGNIRELRNVLERAMILATGPALHVELAEPGAAPVTPQPSQDIRSVEREHIQKVLQQKGWRIRGPHGAAAALGINPTTLEYRMVKLGIRRPGAREDLP
jgi:formate hydrogenlyase transcriptional activator